MVPRSNRKARSTISLRLSVTDRLLPLLVSGKLPPGRINESQLARRLRVSRTPLREALVSLEREGFVKSELRGFAIPPLQGREVRELYPMIGSLEGLALRLAAPFETQQLKELKAANRIFQQAAESTVRALEADNQFHKLLLRYCPNRRLLRLLERQKLLLRRYEILYLTRRSFFERSVAQHSQIIESLAKDDRNRAIEILDLNWQSGLEMLVTSADWPD